MLKTSQPGQVWEYVGHTSTLVIVVSRVRVGLGEGPKAITIGESSICWMFESALIFEEMLGPIARTWNLHTSIATTSLLPEFADWRHRACQGIDCVLVVLRASISDNPIVAHTTGLVCGRAMGLFEWRCCWNVWSVLPMLKTRFSTWIAASSRRILVILGIESGEWQTMFNLDESDKNFTVFENLISLNTYEFIEIESLSFMDPTHVQCLRSVPWKYTYCLRTLELRRVRIQAQITESRQSLQVSKMVMICWRFHRLEWFSTQFKLCNG